MCLGVRKYLNSVSHKVTPAYDTTHSEHSLSQHFAFEVNETKMGFYFSKQSQRLYCLICQNYAT